jgi:membrane-associated phospholipid phosphatase
VAVAWVASVSAWLEWRSLGRALIPLAWLLTLGTVYGQFHYGVDALAGWLLAATVVLFRERLVAGVAREDAVG